MPERLVFKAIDTIYAAALIPEKWPVFLEQVLDIACVHSAALFFRNGEPHKFDVGATVQIDSSRNKPPDDFDAAVNSVLLSCRHELATRRVFCINDLVDSETLIDSFFCNNNSIPQGTHHAYLGGFATNSNLCGGLAVNRIADQGPCTEAELAKLETLLPHLERALELHVRLTEMESRWNALVKKTEEAIDPPEALLRERYGLTPSEARLSSLLVQGKNLKEAAYELKITMNTVRTHLKRVFSKTDTSRQGELVALLLRNSAKLHSC